MAFIDYYKTLGIAKNAKESDIKKAYRKMARKYHPDLNPNDKEAEKKFKEINEANEVLSNPENRKKYDQYGENWKHAEEFEKAKQQQEQQRSYQRSQQFSSEDFGGGDYSDFFESMFGEARQQSRNVRYKGQDYNTELRLDLKDVYETHKRTLHVGDKKIRLTIPAGVKNGQTIRIKGQGGDGVNGGPKGDLYLRFVIDNHTKFKRDGNDLRTNVDLDLYTAILGGDAIVDSFDGKIKLKIKPETQNGTKVKLKGKGFPVYKKEGVYGDLYISYNILIPTNLSTKEKEMYSELSKLRAA